MGLDDYSRDSCIVLIVQAQPKDSSYRPQRRPRKHSSEGSRPEGGFARRDLELLHITGRGLVRGDDYDDPEAINVRAYRIKRLFDLVAGSIIFLIALPLLVVIPILIVLESRGGAIFSQERMGVGGTWIRIYKFRSMVKDADKLLAKILAEDPVAREQYEVYHKIDNDPRVTRVGKILRKYSLDELPQLINVLKGDISLVGPRGYMRFELEDVGDSPRVEMLKRVRPGLTGFWQVGGRNTVDFNERLDMDVFYIQNWSFGMDMYLLVNTAWMLLFSKGYGSV